MDRDCTILLPATMKYLISKTKNSRVSSLVKKFKKIMQSWKTVDSRVKLRSAYYLVSQQQSQRSQKFSLKRIISAKISKII